MHGRIRSVGDNSTGRGARVRPYFIAPVVGCALVSAASPALIDRKPIDSIQAAFTRRSYAPGEAARLVVTAGAWPLTIQIFRVGSKGGPPCGNERLGELPDGGRFAIERGARQARRTILIHLGHWPSGMYFAYVRDTHANVGFAPFVLRPQRLGSTRIAVVLPTNTWQAYNRHDADGDGRGDTWYADRTARSVDLTRPYVDDGVPPHFRSLDCGFLRWLADARKHVDFLADDDLERFSSGDRLASLYHLVVFPGHEEYVTAHAYALIERYRDLGGNLMFLSANNFYHRIERRGQRIYRTGTWRRLGRPEARLIGIQYLGWNRHRFSNAPYVVTGAALAPWLFEKTGLKNGDRFGRYGIEIDARATSSPSNVRVLAAIPEIFGRGRSAEMTYYASPSGAQVFAAGALNFGGSADQWLVRRLLENLWSRLGMP